MKTALCLSGQTRTWKHTFATIQEKLIQPFNADVFMHTWSVQGNKVPNPDLLDGFSHDTRPLDPAVISEYNPKQAHIEYPDYEYFKGFINDVRFYNVIMMHYSIYRSNLLKFEYEARYNFKYDLVIRCRFDSYFYYVNIERTLPFLHNTIFLAPNQSHGDEFSALRKRILFEEGIRYMPNDQFAYSSSEGMDYYSSLYPTLLKGPSIHDVPLHAEGLLSYYLWHPSCPYEIQTNDGIIRFTLREDLYIPK